MKKIIGAIAAAGLAVLASTAPASALTPTPSAAQNAAFTKQLTTDQQQQFNGLSSVQRNEMVAAFSDPAVFENAYTPAQLAATYPNLTVTDTNDTDSSAGESGSPIQNTIQNPDYTVYSVHSWYHHTVCELFLCNTASLDFYYHTGDGKVLNWQKCTWHDSGFSFPIEITNITTNGSVSGGKGQCDADVQLTELYHLTNGYLDQDMSVDYHGIYSKHFKQVGP